MIDIIYHDGAGGLAVPVPQTGGFEHARGQGEIHCYALFDGVTAMRMHLELDSYTEVRTQVGMLEINFCVSGRFETRFSLRDHVLLKPGDLAVSCYDGLHGTRSESFFPLGCYEGICLEIAPDAAQRWIAQNAPAFFVDLSSLRQTLLESKWYLCRSAPKGCEQALQQLYEHAPELDFPLLRLKVLELLLRLRRELPQQEADCYCSARQAELVRHLRDHLLTNREGYVSLAQLAREHAISVSHLQKLFKQVYGAPVYQYIKEYRLEQAAVELLQGADPITQIAQRAGYDNASKFSAAFKTRYGMTPSHYRLHAKQAAKQSSQTKME